MLLIESIRAGQVLEGSFDEVPLPRLLMGILRGNLTGLLDVASRSPEANYVYFREGVPIAVELPDLRLSHGSALVSAGLASAELGAQLDRALATGGPGGLPSVLDGLPPDLLWQEVEVIRARVQLVGLCAEARRRFRFTEGRALPQGAKVTVLRPLSILYEGLARHAGSLAAEIAAEHSAFVLSESFPRGQDAFGWGSRLDRVFEALCDTVISIPVLAAAGIDREQANAAVAALFLADMIRTPAGRPSFAESKAPGSEADQEEPSDAFPKEDIAACRVPEAPSREQHERDWSEIAEQLDPVRGLSYYELLETYAAASLDEIESAYRGLVDQSWYGKELGGRVWRDLLGEAYETLSGELTGSRYREAVEAARRDPAGERARAALEVSPKLDRVARALARGRTAEAEYLLFWAEELEPARPDLAAHRLFLNFVRAPLEDRLRVAESIRQGLSRVALEGKDVLAALYFIVVLSELGERKAARQLLSQLQERRHPLHDLARRCASESPAAARP